MDTNVVVGAVAVIGVLAFAVVYWITEKGLWLIGAAVAGLVLVWLVATSVGGARAVEAMAVPKAPAVSAPAVQVPTVTPAPAAAPAVAAPTAVVGVSPQQSGKDAPQSVQAASEVLGVPQDALTVLYLAPGNTYVIGWVVGRPPFSTVYSANVPVGTCIDFPRSSGKLTGNVTWRVAYYPVDWDRALMASTGTISAPKSTVYWTSCQKGEGTEVAVNQQISAPQAQQVPVAPATAIPAPTAVLAPQVATCPTSPSEASTLMGGKSDNWSVLPNSNSTGWKYKGESTQLTSPNFGRVDAPSGSFRNGQKVNTAEATLWCAA